MESITISPPNWEQEIAEMLDELSDVQDQLFCLLDEKRQRMAAGDLERMEQSQDVERELCQRLEGCHNRRAALLESARQHGIQADSIERLATLECPKHGQHLRKHVKVLSQRMQLLQHQSLTNWVIAQRSLIHLSQMLEIIASGGRIQPTYEKGKSSSVRGALVDHEA